MVNKIPLIALVGLPNSGKSTLLNRLTGTKKAIVAKEAHTTRDLNYGEDFWEGMYMRFVDTGGLVPDPSDQIQKAVQLRSWAGIAEADLLVWVIDRKQDTDTISDKVIQKIWKAGKPYMICINKVDDPNVDKEISEYARLGGFEFVNVSATTGYGLNTLMDMIVEKLEEIGFEKGAQEQVLINNQKRKKVKQTNEVRKHKEGGYYVVRDEEGLFESIEIEKKRKREEDGEVFIKNVIFDFDGVTFKNRDGSFRNVLAKKFDILDLEFDAAYFVASESGFLQEETKYWQAFLKPLKAKIKLTATELKKIYFKINEPVTDVIDFIKDQKRKAKKIYYLTNNSKTHFLPRTETKTFELFDGGLASYQVGIEKPSPEIFEILVEKYKLNPTETLFIDDKEENVQAAKQFGLHSFVYNDEEIDLHREFANIEDSIYLSWLPKPVPKILFLGKPNVGKSSLFNAMVGEQIQIVTDIAGTTLSVNDIMVERIQGELSVTTEVSIDKAQQDVAELAEGKKKYILLDSTGIRRPGQRTFGAESFATFRTVQAAHDADVICLILDGSQPLAHQDQVVAGVAKEARKGMVILANKADLVDDEQRQQFVKEFYNKFNFLKIEKFLWISATGVLQPEEVSRRGYVKTKNYASLGEVWDAIDEALENREKVIERTELRKLFNYLMKQKPPTKLRIKKRPVIYDLLYTKSKPPTFELLVKDKTTVHWSYLRFLENIIRQNFDFQATEIVVKLTEIDRSKVIVS